MTRQDHVSAQHHQSDQQIYQDIITRITIMFTSKTCCDKHPQTWRLPQGQQRNLNEKITPTGQFFQNVLNQPSFY